MKKYLLALVLGSGIVALAACGGGGDTTNNAAPGGTEAPAAGGDGTVDVAAAEALYKQSCASCHGGNLDGGFGPKLSQVGSKYSSEEIENIILNGQGSMQGGFLKGDDATLVANWLAQQK